MSNEFVDVLNLETGQRGRIRRNLFESPVFNPGILEEVDPTQKPYVSEMYKDRRNEKEEPTTEDVKADEAEAEEED